MLAILDVCGMMKSPDDAQMYNTEDGMTITDEDGNEYEISDWTEVGETEYED